MKFFRKIFRFFRLLFALRRGTDVGGTIDEISKNVALRGVNIWLLVCSALLASIGLDVNSTAVIIGAMLISPLMSPILGVGLGVAIFDKMLLKNSFKNLSLATVISLVTSFAYFSVSPLGELTSELEARTTPTILDVGVAFFGGVAGIVAGSRRDKTNAIPGVAIATALMPPLCTAGFGLARMSSATFLGAFYLYFINAFFISLSTYLIAIWLKFPKRARVDEEQNTKFKWLIIGFAILIIIPSALIFYNVLEKFRFDKSVKNFVNREVRRDERQPVQWEVSAPNSARTLKIYTVGNAVTDEEERELEKTLARYGIGELRLKIIELNVSPEEFSRLTSNVETDIAGKLDLLQKIEEENRAEIERLNAEVAEIKENTDAHKLFLRDARRLFPELEAARWQAWETGAAENLNDEARVLVVKFKKEIGEAEKSSIKERIEALARIRWSDGEFRLTEAPPEEERTNENNSNQSRTQQQQQ